MRVVHVSTRDLGGGAARSAHRIHTGLLRIGVDSTMFVRDRTSDSPRVAEPRSTLARILATNRAHLDNALRLPYRHRDPARFFSPGLIPDGLASGLRSLRPDILDVHWIGDGFVRPSTLRSVGVPIVWTLHDAWAFTGGCHYPSACVRYADRCGACPALGSACAWDLSRAAWRHKRAAARGIDLAVVTPSRWLAKCARESAIFRDRRVEVIPYGLDLAAFRPIRAESARSVLRLPAEARIVLFVAAGGAANPIKGFHLLADALRELSRSGRAAGIELVVVGATSVPDAESLGVPIRCLGPMSDETSLALAYSAADVSVVPSVQENFANTGLEALACGTPVIAFRVGGMPDMVRDRVNGVVVDPFDVRGLADAIRWTLEDRGRLDELSANARRIMEQDYTLDGAAQRYLSLYEELLARSPRAVET